MQPLPGHPHRVVNQFRQAQGGEGSGAGAEPPSHPAHGPAPAGNKGRRAGRRPSPRPPAAAAPCESAPSLPQAAPPSWLQGGDAEDARLQLVTGAASSKGSLGAGHGASAPGALDAPASWAFRGPPFGPTMPGLAAVPPPLTHNSAALPPTADEVVLAETLGQVTTGVRMRSSLDLDRQAPPAILKAQGAQEQQPLQELQPHYHHHHQQPPQQQALDPCSHGAGQEHAAQQGQLEEEDEEQEDGTSVLEALEIMLGHTKGEVPVLGEELETMFAHEEGPPSFEHEQHSHLAHGLPASSPLGGQWGAGWVEGPDAFLSG